MASNELANKNSDTNRQDTGMFPPNESMLTGGQLDVDMSIMANMEQFPDAKGLNA